MRAERSAPITVCPAGFDSHWPAWPHGQKCLNCGQACPLTPLLTLKPAPLCGFLMVLTALASFRINTPRAHGKPIRGIFAVNGVNSGSETHAVVRFFRRHRARAVLTGAVNGGRRWPDA